MYAMENLCRVSLSRGWGIDNGVVDKQTIAEQLAH